MLITRVMRHARINKLQLSGPTVHCLCRVSSLLCALHKFDFYQSFSEYVPVQIMGMLMCGLLSEKAFITG